MTSESVHEKLQRVRRPHVHITYQVETDGEVEVKELPFVIGIIGDFSADGIEELDPLADRQFHSITRETFDDVLCGMKPELNLATENALGEDPNEFLCVALRFKSLTDFSPLGIIRQVPELLALLELRNDIERIQNTHERLNRLEELDDRLSRQLCAIMHHEKFRRLEGSWRGLNYLVEQTEDATDLQFNVFCCTKKELCRDFANCGDLDQSVMFDKIIRDQFDVCGAHPCAVIVCDYEIENISEDLEMLTNFSSVAAVAHCPLLTSPAASVFGLEDWTELPNASELERLFAGFKHVKWNALRTSENSRFIAMAMPRVLARKPYGDRGQKVGAFDFQEFKLDAGGCVQSRGNLCWSNAAYYLAACIARSYAQTGFCTHFLTAENGAGGSLGDLPGCDHRDSAGRVLDNHPIEVEMPDRECSALARLGMIPLCHSEAQDNVAFHTGDTLQIPKKFNRSEHTEIAKAYAWLPYVLAVSRIVHYVKCSLNYHFRDRTNPPDFKTVEETLNHWLSNYDYADPDPSEEVKATLPLNVAAIELNKLPGKPDVLAAEIYLQPWPMMRELSNPISVTLLHDIRRRNG